MKLVLTASYFGVPIAIINQVTTLNQVRLMEKWGPAVRLIGVGFYIVACIVGGVLGGVWLDNHFNTRPILVLVCLILGLVAAFWGVYQMIAPMMNDNKQGRK